MAPASGQAKESAAATPIKVVGGAAPHVPKTDAPPPEDTCEAVPVQTLCCMCPERKRAFLCLWSGVLLGLLILIPSAAVLPAADATHGHRDWQRAPYARITAYARNDYACCEVQQCVCEWSAADPCHTAVANLTSRACSRVQSCGCEKDCHSCPCRCRDGLCFQSCRTMCGTCAVPALQVRYVPQTAEGAFRACLREATLQETAADAEGHCLAVWGRPGAHRELCGISAHERCVRDLLVRHYVNETVNVFYSREDPNKVQVTHALEEEGPSGFTVFLIAVGALVLLCTACCTALFRDRRRHSKNVDLVTPSVVCAQTRREGENRCCC